MIRSRVTALAAGTALVAGTFAVTASPALAADNPYDPGFTPVAGDIVGVGSDTTMTVMQTVAAAYNAGKAPGSRLASFGAALDAADASTVVLREGATAVTRQSINGSGKGKAKLTTDNDPNVDYARSSSSLGSSDTTLLQSAFAADVLQMAVAPSSNAPATLSDQDLVKIYTGQVTDWSQVGGKPGTIVPLMPQSASGTAKFFLEKLQQANDGKAIVLGSNVDSTIQEHSETPIVGRQNPAEIPNAIAPFSAARAKSSTTIKLVGGFAPARAVYTLVRKADLAAGDARAAKLEALFGPNGFLCSAEGKDAIEAAGFDQLAGLKKDGACGVWTPDKVENLKLAKDGIATTTSSVKAVALGGRQVKLTASVKAPGSSISGKVAFFEGATRIAGPVTVAGGAATATLRNVTPGAHSYRAVFTPTDELDQTPSEAAAVKVTVKTPVALRVASARTTYGRAVALTVKASAPVNGAATVAVGGRAYRTVFAKGAARVTVPAGIAAGTQRLTVAFGGSATHDAASAAGTVSVAKAAGVVTAKLSATRIKATKRGSVTVTVVPRGAAKGTPVTGKVTIKRGSKTVGTAVLRGGRATVKLAKLKKGSHKLTVVYSGDRNVALAKGKTLKLTVR